MNEPLGAYLVGFAESLRDWEIAKGNIEKLNGLTGFFVSIPTGGAFGVQRVVQWIREAIEQWKLSSFGLR